MAQPKIQTSFATGELAPELGARVDFAKYHSAAALVKNFFVDYRGGVSTRAGTKYLLQAKVSGSPVRLIPFQASATVGYVLEFGQNYLRFYSNGAAILEATFPIIGASQAAQCVLQVSGNNYAVGDWIFVTGVVGMTQLNNSYFIVSAVVGNAVSITDLNGVPINSLAFGVYVSGGTAARVYTIGTPYLASDLALLKFTQDVTTLIICHPSYQPASLIITFSNRWTLNIITFGTTLPTPTGLNTQFTLPAGSYSYGYLVTAVDINGQESAPSVALISAATHGSIVDDIGSIALTWTAVSGAASYNVYKATPIFNGVVSSTQQFGFVGNGPNPIFVETTPGIAPDFSQTPPIINLPFSGAPILNIQITNQGVYTTVPTATIGAPPPGGVQATINIFLDVVTAGPSAPGTGYVQGDVITVGAPGGGAVTLVITAVTGPGGIISVRVVDNGKVTGAGNPVPANPVSFTGGSGTGGTLNLTWGVDGTFTRGAGYLTPPLITFSSGAAAAFAILDNAGSPSVPGFFQERLALASPGQQLQTIYFSQPGGFFNFNTSFPSEPDDAIIANIVSGELNAIKSMVTAPNGLILLTSQSAWLINGGGFGSATPITPSNVTANSQAFNGASDVPPIQDNYDILYVQAKGSYVRDLTYNLYANIYTGTDISILSSHLFFGFQINEWAWAQEPFKTVWAIRNDGAMLSLAFMKEQEIIGWAQHNTQGLWKSVCRVTEQTSNGLVDAIYLVAQRVVNGNTVQYIERMADRFFPNGLASDYWGVDAGLQYNGAPATLFSGLTHLIGTSVVGLADGVPFGPLTVSATGTITLATPASIVTVGLAYVPRLQTLRLDLGEPTVQGKRKKITAVAVRVRNTLGLAIGKTFSSLVAMKDLVVGNVGSMSDTVVTGLVTDDARTIIDPSWDVPGQFCIQQNSPLPATILGVIPEVVVGDTK